MAARRGISRSDRVGSALALPRVCSESRKASDRSGSHLDRCGSRSCGSSWNGSRYCYLAGESQVSGRWLLQDSDFKEGGAGLTEATSLSASLSLTLDLTAPFGFLRNGNSSLSNSALRSPEIFCNLISRSSSGASMLD